MQDLKNGTTLSKPGQKWLLPYKRGKKNYEDIGCLPYVLLHDRGFGGDKLYRVVRRMPDGGFVYILCQDANGEQLGPFYKRRDAVAILKQKYQEACR